MKRILVTGASGFCGLHLCRRLARRKVSVTGTVFGPSKYEPIQGVSFVPLDITDFDQTVAVIRAERPDQIYHLAAMSIPQLSWREESQTFEINVGGTIHLLEAVRRYVPKARVLFASTVHVYGRSFSSGKPVKETDLIWPESPYAASKAVAEMACLHYNRQFGSSVIISRAFNHIGAGQGANLVLADWSRQVTLAERGRRQPVLKVGNVNVKRDFLHVADVINAYEILMKKGKPGTIYNIASGKAYPLKDYVRKLCQSARITMRVQVCKKRMRHYDHPVMSGSVSRLRSLGWRPRHSPFDAMAEMMTEWRRESGKHG